MAETWAPILQALTDPRPSAHRPNATEWRRKTGVHPRHALPGIGRGLDDALNRQLDARCKPGVKHPGRSIDGCNSTLRRPQPAWGGLSDRDRRHWRSPGLAVKQRKRDLQLPVSAGAAWAHHLGTSPACDHSCVPEPCRVANPFPAVHPAVVGAPWRCKTETRQALHIATARFGAPATATRRMVSAIAAPLAYPGHRESLPLIASLHVAAQRRGAKLRKPAAEGRSPSGSSAEA